MIIFLDIDGVLLHGKCNSIVNQKIKDQFDPKCVDVLNRLCKKLDAKIVISSSWRMCFLLEHLQKFFIEQKIEAEIIGETPSARKQGKLYISRGRGAEILDWIKENNYKGEYIVIDDEISDIKSVIPLSQIIYVDGGWYERGLEEKHIEKFIKV